MMIGSCFFLNKLLTVPIEDVLSFKDSADRIFEMLLRLFLIWKAQSCNQLVLLFLYVILQLNNQYYPVF